MRYLGDYLHTIVSYRVLLLKQERYLANDKDYRDYASWSDYACNGTALTAPNPNTPTAIYDYNDISGAYLWIYKW